MTVDEIYAKVAQHMKKGIAMHRDLANYFDFLGLRGYKRCQEYRYLDEICGYRNLCRYFVNHHNKLIPELEVEEMEVIPDSWYKYTRQDVDNSTKANAVKKGLMIWEDWEKESKQLYEDMYKELIDIDEVASAFNIQRVIEDVDCELKKVERYALNHKAIDYDLEVIILNQPEIHDRYAEKIKDIGKKLC